VADDATLTLADVRLAAVRLAVVVALVAGLASVFLPARELLRLVPLVLAAGWLLVPATLVERSAERRGHAAIPIGLATAMCAVVLTPAALLQGWWLDATLLAGRPFAPFDLRKDELLIAFTLGPYAAFLVGGAAAFLTLRRARAPSSGADELLVTLSLFATFVLVVPYLLAERIDRTLASGPEPA